MAKPPEKKPEPAKPTDVRVLPMELRIADRFTDATGEWEVISRPYASAGGKRASAHVHKIGRPESTDLRTWNGHARIAVRRAWSRAGVREALSGETWERAGGSLGGRQGSRLGV